MNKNRNPQNLWKYCHETHNKNEMFTKNFSKTSRNLWNSTLLWHLLDFTQISLKLSRTVFCKIISKKFHGIPYQIHKFIQILSSAEWNFLSETISNTILHIFNTLSHFQVFYRYFLKHLRKIPNKEKCGKSKI